jgi:hypothetical protein
MPEPMMGSMSFASIRRDWLPSGHGLPESVWRRRHGGILLLLWLHAAGLAIFGVIRGFGVAHAVLEGGIVAAFAVVATVPSLSVRARSAAATLGLVSASAVLVHVSGGVIEAHFHFFAMVGIITLYQDWVPFGLAIGFVAVHHGVASTIDRRSVYNHYAALNNPWKWALIHGLFVLGASAASVYAWRMNEEAAAETERYRYRLEDVERRRKSALQINDDIVQGLAVVTSALALGHDDLARREADRTLVAARAIITDLLGEDDTPVVAGSLRRSQPAERC